MAKGRIISHEEFEKRVDGDHQSQATLDLPAAVAEHPLRDKAAWVALRDSGIAPRDASPMLTTQEARDEFLAGAWLLNATTREGMLNSITPQMLRAADVLEHARRNGVLISAVLMPRRSGKTTVMLCVLLGRCYLNPVHYAGFALLTTQKKTSERYRLDVYGPIIRQWPDEETRPVKVIRSNGNERVEFRNGSNLAVLSPEGDAIRSGAYDSLLLDEGGEASIERWEDVIGAVLPSFDTRPEGQLVLAGTAGDYRDGSQFWATLNDARSGRINFSAPDDLDPEILESWDGVRPIVEAIHPGIGTLTTIERIEQNYTLLGVKKFTREYLNVFGAEGANTALISQPLWLESALDLNSLTAADQPTVSAIVLEVNRDADWASVAQAWKGKDGRTHVALLHHQAGVKGLPMALLGILRKSKRQVTYDTGGAGAAATANVVAQLREARPAPAEHPLTSRDSRRASVHFMTLLREGSLRHYSQEPLDSAVEVAVKRAWSTGTGWGFGTPKSNPDADITALEAVAKAAYALQDERATSAVSIDFFEV